jgi:hypothetical protein
MTLENAEHRQAVGGMRFVGKCLWTSKFLSLHPSQNIRTGNFSNSPTETSKEFNIISARF